jgi:hypothetical protein
MTSIRSFVIFLRIGIFPYEKNRDDADEARRTAKAAKNAKEKFQLTAEAQSSQKESIKSQSKIES